MHFHDWRRIGWLILTGLCVALPYQTESRVRTGFDVEREVRGDGSRGPFSLNVRDLVRGSESVYLGERLLKRTEDYTLSYVDGALVLVEPVLRGEILTIRAQKSFQVLPGFRRREALHDSSRVLISLPKRDRIRKSQTAVEPISGGLQVTGVKRLQVAVGTFPEAALNQSLRLEVSGMISEGVRVKGFLTDRSLPVRSTGRSRSLNDLDRVHLEVASSRFTAVLGDVDVAFQGTEFARYKRQLQGARFRVSGDHGDLDLFGAVAEGEWTSRRVQTRAGYQGPYGLSTGGRPIAAGSERLFLNGRQLLRGESLDYVIDYDRGLVTFTPGRPITGESRVIAEFQTVDPDGRIRSLGLRGQMSTGDEKLRFGTTLLRESRGASLATGTTFSGAALPGAFLSSVDGMFSPQEGVQLDGEFAWTRSANIDNSSIGHAVRVGLTWQSEQARERISGIRAVRLTAKLRDVGESFQALDGVESIRREGIWGWESNLIRGAGRETEMTLRYVPFSFASVGTSFGYRSGEFGGHRFGTSASMDGGRYGQANVSLDRVERVGGRLSRFSGGVRGKLGWFRPTVRLRSETAAGSAVRGSRFYYTSISNNLPEGIRVREADVVSEVGAGRVLLTSSLTVSQVDQLVATWTDSSREWTQMNSLTATTVRGFRFVGSFGQTSRLVNGSPRQTVSLGRFRVSHRLGSGLVNQDIQYQVSSTGLADQERVYMEVPDGEGTYVWEDVDGDGARDPEEFIAETAGNYEPIYGLFTSFQPVRDASIGLRTVMDFSRGPFSRARLLRDLAFEVSLESERRTSPDVSIGIAPPSLIGFTDEEGLMSARRSVRSTLHLFRRRTIGSIRIDSRLSDDLDRRLSEDGRTKVREWVFVGKVRPSRGWDTELRVETGARRRAGKGAFAHNIAERGLEVRNWVRLPDGWQTGLTIGWGRDRERQRDLHARRISIGPELRRALRGRGRLTSRFDWVRVTSDDPLPLFLGLAQGHRKGVNYRWRFGVDYRLGAYVDAFMTYDATIRPERPALHVGRVEIRASF